MFRKLWVQVFLYLGLVFVLSLLLLMMLILNEEPTLPIPHTVLLLHLMLQGLREHWIQMYHGQ